MPYKPRSGCTYPGCAELASIKGRCAAHEREAWEGRRGFEGYKGEYLAIRRQVLQEERACAFCGAPSVTVDHIVPVSRGGSHARENLRALCKPCHDRRSRAQTIEAAGKRPKND